jgi:hypothetical protein
MRPSSQKHDLGSRRWLVQFDFRFADAHRRSVVEGLGILAHEVVRLWVDVIIAGAIGTSGHANQPRSVPTKVGRSTLHEIVGWQAPPQESRRHLPT